MSETVVLYRNRDSWVEANPGDGVVHIRAKRHGQGETYYEFLGYTITADGRQRVWWKPWTWGSMTVGRAMKEAIARCDEAERKAEVGRFNLKRAQSMVQEYQAHAEALASIDAMLAALPTEET